MFTPPQLRLGAGAIALLLVVAVVALVLGRDDETMSKQDERPAAPTSLGADGPPVSAFAADFAESVGVNVHLTYNDTAYGDFPAVRRALRALGIRQIRDGLVLGRPDQYEAIRALAQDGVRTNLILGQPGEDLPSLLATLRTELRPAVAAVEGPNEYDASDDPRWAAQLRAYQRAMYDAIQRDLRLRRLPVWAPSLIRLESRAELGDLTASLDRGNLHSYPGGGAPEDNLERERDLASLVSGDEPLVATETGYHNATAATEGQPGVEEAVAGDYAPRLFLSYFRSGIKRTFWYELVDEKPDPARSDPEQNFGLLRNDFSPKPAGRAVANLLRLVRGGDRRTSGGEPVPAPTVGPTGERVHSLLLRRPDGSALLALWRPVELPDAAALAALERDPLEVGVRLAAPAELRVHRPSRSAKPVARPGVVREVEVPLAGDATVLEIRP